MSPFSLPYTAKRATRRPTSPFRSFAVGEHGARLGVPALLTSPAPGFATLDHPPQRHLCWGRSCSSSHSLRVSYAQSDRVPRESLDVPEDLPKEGPRQVAFGKLEDEVPRMPDEAPAGLE